MKLLIFVSASLISLAGCHSSSNNSNPQPTPDVNQLVSLSKQDVNSEPGSIENAVNLQNDINTLFDDIDPVEVKPGDDLSNVINRAGDS